MSIPADYFQLSLRSGDSPTRMNSGADVKLHRGCCGLLHGRGVSKVSKSAGSNSGSTNSLYNWDARSSDRKHPASRNCSLSSLSSTSSWRSRSSSSLSPPHPHPHPHRSDAADQLERVREEDDDDCTGRPSGKRALGRPKYPPHPPHPPPPVYSGRNRTACRKIPARRAPKMVSNAIHFFQFIYA